MYERDVTTNMHQEIPKYERIALDIAYSIYHGDWQEGEKVKGRSTLSGKYKVSPETIRRAMKLLSDMKVVEVIDKIGIYIKSKEKAHAFIQEFQSKNEILNLKENIKKLTKQKQAIEQTVMENVDSIIEYSIRLRNIGIIYPLELKVHEKSHIIGRSIGDTRFWNHTGATIIGINREGHLFLSPGPHMVFHQNDVILYVGNVENIAERVNEYVNKEV